jgi:hypothetical protein
MDWWHGDGDHGENEEPAPLRQDTIPAVPQARRAPGCTEQFFTVGSPYWPDQPSRSKHKVVEL